MCNHILFIYLVLKGCSLAALLESLQEHFSKDPPVYSRQKEEDHPKPSNDRDISPPQQTRTPDAVRPPLPSKPPSIMMSPPSVNLTNPVCFFLQLTVQSIHPSVRCQALRHWGCRPCRHCPKDHQGWSKAGLHHLQIILPYLLCPRDHISTELTNPTNDLDLHRPYRRYQNIYFHRQFRDLQNLMLTLTTDNPAHLLHRDCHLSRFPIF